MYWTMEFNYGHCTKTVSHSFIHSLIPTILENTINEFPRFCGRTPICPTWWSGTTMWRTALLMAPPMTWRWWRGRCHSTRSSSSTSHHSLRTPAGHSTRATTTSTNCCRTPAHTHCRLVEDYDDVITCHCVLCYALLCCGLVVYLYMDSLVKYMCSKYICTLA